MVKEVPRLHRRKDMTVGEYDPMKGERLAPAWLAIVAVMDDGEWHTRDDLVNVGLSASDLQRASVLNMLSKLSAPDGPIERKGSVKTRRYRLVVE